MKILHLYYDLMNLYGDYGNVAALERKLTEKGAEVTVDRLSLGDDIDFCGYSFIFIGSGTENNQKVALSDLKNRFDNFSEALKNGVVVLATGNSFEIFGKSITDCDGNKYDGLGVFDFTVTESDKRTVTDAKCTAEFLSEPVIGFVNKASEIYGVSTPLFDMTEGSGNCKGEKTEGFVSGSFYGTHIIGPLLIRNPEVCEYFADMLLNK